jgi:hypothetical protein
MANKITEVTTRSWGGKIMDSIKGVVFGIVLFLAAFVVLWINEGRTDMSKVAMKETVPVDAAVLDVTNEGKPVSVTGMLTSYETIGDPEFLNPGKYLVLTRNVEMYAWVENSESKTEKNVGGSETTTTTYTYAQEWTSNPADSSTFKDPAGHTNPPMPYQDQTFYVNTASVGVYPVDVKSLSLPGESEVVLNTSSVNPKYSGMVNGNYIFVKPGGYGYYGSNTAPTVGDVRIHYTALASDVNVTVFGQLQGGQIVPYIYKGEDRLYHARTGTREEAIATLSQEHKTVGWILRLVGFLMMWIGLTMCFAPINAVLDVLPFLGNVGRGLISIVMFIVALGLSIATIIVSMIAHNPIALIITIVILIGVVFLIGRLIKKRKAAPQTPAA